MTAPGTLSVAAAADQWEPGALAVEDRVDESQLAALADLLGTRPPGPGEPIRALWHEVLLREPIRYSELGADGHPASSALLPPIKDRRRMFGGSQVRRLGALFVGDVARRTARVAEVRHRSGRAGELLLVTEEHVWTVAGEPRLEERRLIVYRSAERASMAEPQPERLVAAGEGETVLDERFLFVFSALTANTHRIHYDAAYAREVEGHRGLLVHGPLTALLAAEAVQRELDRPISAFDYRLVAPCHAGEPLSFVVTAAEGDELLVVGRAAGRDVLTATAELG
jgi:3-methylfumaryl-CoA hydratase